MRTLERDRRFEYPFLPRGGFYKTHFLVHIVRSRPPPSRGEKPTMSGGPMVRIPLPVAKPVELDAGLANRGNSRTGDRDLFPARTNPGVCETQIRAAHAVPGWRARPRNPRCR